MILQMKEKLKNLSTATGYIVYYVLQAPAFLFFYSYFFVHDSIFLSRYVRTKKYYGLYNEEIYDEKTTA